LYLSFCSVVAAFTVTAAGANQEQRLHCRSAKEVEGSSLTVEPAQLRVKFRTPFQVLSDGLTR
jgi:hypothetical protein